MNKLYMLYEGDVKAGETADAHVLASTTKSELLSRFDSRWNSYKRTWFVYDIAPGGQLINGRLYEKKD
jgi:hypothetical protein